MNAEQDPILQTRLDVAEMKGMLAQLVSAHAERINALEVRSTEHEARLNDKKESIGRIDERVKDLEDDNTGRHGRTTGVISLIISGAVGLLAILNSLRIQV